jgi:hypothetical protein
MANKWVFAGDVKTGDSVTFRDRRLVRTVDGDLIFRDGQPVVDESFTVGTCTNVSRRNDGAYPVLMIELDHGRLVRECRPDLIVGVWQYSQHA